MCHEYEYIATVDAIEQREGEPDEETPEQERELESEEVEPPRPADD